MAASVVALESIGILVPADRIARVIGKAGSGLKHVRESAGCKVQVHQHVDQTGLTRRVDVSGTVDQLCAAFYVTLQRAFEEPHAITIALLVPSDKAGPIVGKNGENLKRVREEHRVRVQLEREPVMDPTTWVQERLMTMQGELAHLVAALRYCLGNGAPPAMTQVAAFGGPIGHSFPFGGPVGHSFAPLAARCVRPASGDPHEVQVHMVVPDRCVGHILGKAGAQVKQTAAAAGCRISMTPKESGDPRRAVITGNHSQCMTAQGLLYDQILSVFTEEGKEMTEVTVLYMIHRGSAGAVIGKQGAGLKRIREQSGANVQVGREEVEGHRVCTIVGTFSGVCYAQKAIHDMSLEGAQEQSPNGAGGGGHSPPAQAQLSPPPTKLERFDSPSTSLVPAKRQRTDADSGATKLLVPSAAAGAVIGKQGSGLRTIRETHGVKIDMMAQSQNPFFVQDRVMSLVGPLLSRQAALAAVLASVAQGQDASVLKMLIPSPMAGAVIGKAGQTLKTIREQTSVSVQVERDDIGGERLVIAAGTLFQVSTVAAMVLGIIDQQSADAAQGSSANDHQHRAPTASAFFGGALEPQHVIGAAGRWLG